MSRKHVALLNQLAQPWTSIYLHHGKTGTLIARAANGGNGTWRVYWPRAVEEVKQCNLVDYIIFDAAEAEKTFENYLLALSHWQTATVPIAEQW